MMYDGVIDLLGVAGSYCSTRFLSSLCFSVVASIAACWITREDGHFLVCFSLK